MSFNNYSNNRSGGYNNNNYGRNNNRSGGYKPEIKPIPKSAPLPADFVTAAEEVMHDDDVIRLISTSGIRNILTMVNDIYNIEYTRTNEELTEESLAKIQQLRIRLLYESGRTPKTGKFIEKTNLIPYLKDIGNSRKKFINYSHYMEALVAYHRYYGGREN